MKRLNWLEQNYYVHKKNSNEHDLIKAGLFGMGYNRIVGHTKRQFQTTNLLEVESKSKNNKNKHFTSCNDSKCPYPKVSKEKQISLFFSMFFLDSLCPFKKKCLKSFYLSSFIHILTLISYKCKYVLFHLHMLRLFQDINILFCFEIKLVSNKNFSLK